MTMPLRQFVAHINRSVDPSLIPNRFLTVLQHSDAWDLWSSFYPIYRSYYDVYILLFQECSNLISSFYLCFFYLICAFIIMNVLLL